jgi:hypothetical protein
MRRLKTVTSLLVVAGVSALGLGTTAANAATSGSTIATFNITAGALSITVPASTVALGTASSGAATVSGSLGTVAVSDQRANLVAAWTTTVTSTSFVTGGGSANETVANTAIAYTSGTLTTTGLGVFAPSVSATVGAGVTAVSLAAGSGVNTANWNPTIAFTLGAAQVAGTYTGTITHSVA